MEEDEKKEEDIDLKDLEDEEKEAKKENTVNQANVSYPVEKKENKNHISPKEQEIKTESNKAVENFKIDLYSEKSENLYHRADKMQSLGALMEEKKLMDVIIEYKKKNGFDPDAFETKKDIIDVKYKEIENIISFGAMDLNEYKTSITNQLKWDEELIKFAEKDQKITSKEKEKVIERIKKRIEIIQSELSQEVQEEEEEQNEEENIEQDIESKPAGKEDSTANSTAKISTENEIKAESAIPLEKKPPEIKNKKLYEDIKVKLNDYKEAAEYFRKIGSAKQEEDAYSKAKEFQAAIKLIENGKEDQVDEFALPIGITPDYICGYSKQERLNKFSEIIKEFSRRKNELNEALIQRTEKLKTIDKKEFMKIKDIIKKDLDERKAKIDFHNKLILKLTEYAKNPWVPAPLYSYIEEEEKIEKINEEIDQHWIHIYIGKSTYDKENAYLMVNLSKV